jgi:hypothetical protein
MGPLRLKSSSATVASSQLSITAGSNSSLICVADDAFRMGYGMTVGTGVFEEPDRRDGSSHTKSLKTGCLNGIAAGVLTALVLATTSALADEFDALAIYSEAQPLNDRWQACAASFVKPRLRSQQSPDALAKEALDSCRSEQDRLRLFFAGKIGKRSAGNVVALLREKYQADLISAINELRRRE